MCELPPEWRKEIPEEPLSIEDIEQLVEDVWQVEDEGLNNQLKRCLSKGCGDCLFRDFQSQTWI